MKFQKQKHYNISYKFFTSPLTCILKLRVARKDMQEAKTKMKEAVKRRERDFCICQIKTKADNTEKEHTEL